MATLPYKLSCAIYGHKSDVRSVTVTKDGKIVSGSRDMTAKLWTPNESGCGYKEYLTLSSHKNFVSCVCALPPSDTFCNGLIVTGSNDKTIRLFDGIQSDPIEVLNGHGNTVCKVVPGINPNTILSSSWDHTAKLWDLVLCKAVAVFSGHEAAVWSVIQLPCGIVATASADKKIKIWIKNGTCLNTLNGHTDCIRDLAFAAPKEILSCSNDATIRHWNVESGQCLNTFFGHGHFIYSIFHIDSTSFLTSSEDRTVKLWVNGKVTDSIAIPANSIWSVATMPNGDIVTGSSDGVVRVFSTDASRHASFQELKEYEDQISNIEKNTSQEIGGIKISELPGEEALLKKGVSDGQTKIIKNGNKVVAYSWSADENKWNLIGDVTGSYDSDKAGETGKPKYQGKEYDYVFSVDIEPGKPLLKLPYNKTDDPWHAAQKFIHDNQLSQNFLDEVANFIIRNSNCTDNQVNDLSDFVDPFTGEGRYIPGSNFAAEESRNRNSDSFFTTPICRNDKQSDLYLNSYFPQREFLRFDQANINLILEKLLEFNKNGDNRRPTVSDSQIESLVKTCESGANCSIEDIETLNRLLEWPEETVFPVLDIMRLSIRNSQANTLLCNDKLIPKLMNYLSPNTGVTPNTMLALRVLSNMVSGDAGLSLAYENKLKLLEIIENVKPPLSKPVQVAMSTLLLNVAVMVRRSETPDGRSETLSVIQRTLTKFNDQEALFRTLVALGTLLVDMVDSKKYISAFEELLIKYQSDSAYSSKIQQCCQYILLVLR